MTICPLEDICEVAKEFIRVMCELFIPKNRLFDCTTSNKFAKKHSFMKNYPRKLGKVSKRINLFQRRNSKGNAKDFGKVSSALLVRIQDGVLNSERVHDRDRETFRGIYKNRIITKTTSVARLIRFERSTDLSTNIEIARKTAIAA